MEEFFGREAPRYGVAMDQRVHAELYPRGSELPPALEPGAGPLGIAWWSLKLRWFAAHATEVPGRASPRIRMFVLYHDPATLDRVPDSHGLQKGLIGVVHAFALPAMAGGNNIVIAHELMHTLGASDKYDLGSGAPLYPNGFAEPDREPLYPQGRAEVIAGRPALSARDLQKPPGPRDVVVGPATAPEVPSTAP